MVIFVLFIIQESKSIRHILSGAERSGSMRKQKFSHHRKHNQPGQANGPGLGLAVVVTEEREEECEAH